MAGIYKLKGDQTPLYNLARSLGLVGPLHPQHAVLMETAVVNKNRVRPPKSTRMLLVVLRMMVGLASAWPSMGYLLILCVFEFREGLDLTPACGTRHRIPMRRRRGSCSRDACVPSLRQLL